MFNDYQKRAFREAEENGFDQLKDGDYCAVLDNVIAKEFGEKKEIKLMLALDVISPEESRGAKHFVFQSMEKNLGFLKALLSNFHIDHTNMELEDVLPAMESRLGANVFFKLETKNKFQNTFIKAVEEPQEVKPIEVDDEDIPF